MAERSSPAPKRERRPPHDLSFVQRLTDPVTTFLANAVETIKPRIDWQWCRQNPFRAIALPSCSLYLICCASYLAWIIAHLAWKNFHPPVESIWLVDSTSAVHTTNDLSDFSVYQAFIHTHPLNNAVNISHPTFINGMEVYGHGAVKLEIPNWPDTSLYLLRNVLYIPSQPKRISLGVLARARKEYRWDHSCEPCEKGDELCKGWENRPITLESCGFRCFDDGADKLIDFQGFQMLGYTYAINAHVMKEWSCGTSCNPCSMHV